MSKNKTRVIPAIKGMDMPTGMLMDTIKETINDSVEATEIYTVTRFDDSVLKEKCFFGFILFFSCCFAKINFY